MLNDVGFVKIIFIFGMGAGVVCVVCKSIRIFGFSVMVVVVPLVVKV